MQALGLKQGGEQSVFVFAVAVLVVKDLPGSVRLVAARAQRQTDVAEILRDEVVESLNLVHLRVEAFGEFVGLGANFRRGSTPVFFQARIPAADLFPTDERGQLNVGILLIGGLLLSFGFGVLIVFVFVLVLCVVFALQVRARPVVDAPSVLFGDLWIHAWLVLQLEGAIGRDI